MSQRIPKFWWEIYGDEFRKCAPWLEDPKLRMNQLAGAISQVWFDILQHDNPALPPDQQAIARINRRDEFATYAKRDFVEWMKNAYDD